MSCREIDVVALEVARAEISWWLGNHEKPRNFEELSICPC